MFDRCMQQAGITPEEIISNNPNPSNPEEINPGVGFIDYIAMAGTTDYKESMIKGAVVVQNVVSMLGYQGSWLEFVCFGTSSSPTPESCISGESGKSSTISFSHKPMSSFSSENT